MAKKDLTPQIFLLDTNAIVQLLKGNEQLITVLSQADFIAVSVISRLEFLSFSGLSDNDKILYESFEKRISWRGRYMHS